MHYKHSISIGGWNVNGWTNRNSALREQIIIKLSIDIVCVCETHFSNDNKVDIHNLDHYTWFTWNRQSIHVNAVSASGGVAILVKNELFKEFNIDVVDKCFEGILGIQLSHKCTEFKITVICCYLPPQNSPWGRDSISFFAHIAQLLYAHDTDLFFICGDLNGRIGNMNDVLLNTEDIPSRHVVDHTVNSHGEALVNFLKEISGCVLNGRFNVNDQHYTSVSSKGKSVVDYLITSTEHFSYVNDLKVYLMHDLIEQYELHTLLHDRCKSPDHSFICMTIDVSGFMCIENYTAVNQPRSDARSSPCPMLYNFKNIPDNFMHNIEWDSEIQNINVRMSEIITPSSLNELCEDLYSILRQEISRCFSIKTTQKPLDTSQACRRARPYWNSTLTDLFKDVKYKQRIFLKTNKVVDPFIYARVRAEFQTAQKLFDCTLRKIERQHNRAQIAKIDTLNTNNPKVFWEHINKLGPGKKGKLPCMIKDINEHVLYDINNVLDVWKTSFMNTMNINEVYDDVIYSENIYAYCWLEYCLKYFNDTNSELNAVIHVDDLSIALRKLKNGKSPGFDEIPNEILKCDRFKTVLLKLFNVCLSIGSIPDIWLKAVICPIPKSKTKDPLVPHNYRGISLISNLSKLFSSILNARLDKFVEARSLLADEQNGFRSDRSCVDHIFSLSVLIRNRLRMKQNLFCAFIDLEKAFDRIDRRLLFYRLLKCGINGNLYNVIKAMYSDTVSSVRVNNNLTEWFHINCGVRQGDILSPLLFNIYINDLLLALKKLDSGVVCGNTKICCLLYADDLVLIAENENCLQKLLNVMYSWCDEWKLKVNLSKSNVVHFRPKQWRRSDRRFMYGNDEMVYTNVYKYLGVLLDENLNFDQCCQSLSDAGFRSLGGVIGKSKCHKDFGYNTYTKLYDSCVSPVTEYASAVWGFKQCEAIDKVFYAAMRYYLGVHKLCPKLAILGEMGWKTPYFRQHLNMIRLWNRLCRMSNDRLTKQVFLYDYSLCKSNWSSEVKSILYKINQLQCFTSCMVVNLENFKYTFSNIVTQNWLTDLTKKPKLRTYQSMKAHLNAEYYVKCFIPKHKRSLLAQIRCGILPLKIETGRFQQIPLELRLCILCNLQEVETEEHFVCRCTKFQSLREKLFECASKNKPNFIYVPDHEKLNLLLTVMWRECVNIFLVPAWTLRTNAMYITM